MNLPWQLRRSPRQEVMSEASDSAIDNVIRQRMCPLPDTDLDFSLNPDLSPTPQKDDRRVPFEEEPRVAAVGLRYLDHIGDPELHRQLPFWLVSSIIDTASVTWNLMSSALGVTMERRALSMIPFRYMSDKSIIVRKARADERRDDLIDKVVMLRDYHYSLLQAKEAFSSEQYWDHGDVNHQMPQSDAVRGAIERSRQSLDLATDAINSAFRDIAEINNRQQRNGYD